MYFPFILAFLLPWVLAHNASQPGVLLENPGQVKLARHVVTVKLDFTPLPRVANQLGSLKNSLDSVWFNVKKVIKKGTNSSTFGDSYALHQTQLHLWQWKVEQSHYMINSILVQIPKPKDRSSESMPNRIKRGLFNFVGDINSYLFGTATQEQIDEVETKLSAVKDAQQQEMAIIASNSHILEQHKDKINDLVTTVNEILGQTNLILSRVEMLTAGNEMELWIDNIYSQVVFYSSLFSRLLDAMGDLGNQKVTPNVLHYAELKRVIQKAEDQYQLIPAVPKDSLYQYYALISVSFFNHTVWLHIPFVESRSFTAYKLYPFPSFHGSHIASLDIEYSLYLESDDSVYSVLSTTEALESCRKAGSLYICLPSTFMLTSFQTESCMGQIVRSRPPFNCSFNFINNSSGIQKQSLDSATYLFFPRPISLSFTCPPQEADGLKVVGRMLVPPVCSVIAGQIRLLGVRSTNLKLAQSAVGNATVYDPQHQFTRHFENLRN